jgi:hypothetical protein
MDHNSNLGDQLHLNHVIASASPADVKWLSDDRRYIFNLEIGDGLHPYVDDPGLARLRLAGNEMWRDGRRVLLFYWVKPQFDPHFESGFSTFHPEVQSFLAELYSDTPVR